MSTRDILDAIGPKVKTRRGFTPFTELCLIGDKETNSNSTEYEV